jgi:hypothetical protein
VTASFFGSSIKWKFKPKGVLGDWGFENLSAGENRNYHRDKVLSFLQFKF